METIVIKTQAEFDEYFDEARSGHFFDGHLTVKCSISAAKKIDVKGWLYIKAGLSIEAGGYIKAGGYIEAGGYIFSFQFDISAKWISTKILPFWRKYWAESPLLKKWKDRILDDEFCWDDLRGLTTEKESAEICSWEGWHWILRGQLECFFELKDRFEPKT